MLLAMALWLGAGPSVVRARAGRPPRAHRPHQGLLLGRTDRQLPLLSRKDWLSGGDVGGFRQSGVGKFFVGGQSQSDQSSEGIRFELYPVDGELGLCFLPAFLCVGIVPLVVGLAGDVLQFGLV
ncbi:alanine rich membrane protein [Mycobacterium tuberculosis]|nr:alanine rich membrane protein [Mycobacterium tuberculosis]